MDQVMYIEHDKPSHKPPSIPTTPSLLCLLGSSDGTIYVYDPIIVEPSRVHRYNNDETMPFHKKKKPTIVKWVEPMGNTNPNKFVAVFEDGCLYIYEKDVVYD